ncbi:MAG TPA: DUF3105 domain-containing protein [Pseudonocardia sp.]|jgi:hypothetical protein|nr:hypothetical protein [Pseudonocardia sp.]MDT7584464.1 hypothetical protein [Pseudonocardiales bacterium]MDT7605922.1 hypothetical protein [Pseudonocardiales bacterium]MDT7622072.1 hypothetical protein [Pseudonocardiales bacterium]MDT7696488.1 hypothetical protein [Pseudonocardiales bacterium]
MASGKNSKAGRNKRAPVVSAKATPWGTIAAVVAVVVFAAAVFGYVFYQNHQQQQKAGALAPYTPSASNQDPAKTIPGVVEATFPAGQHVTPTQRVAYTHFPPFGGAHDYNWAACTGVVYPTAVRNENMVHALEHGAVWIAYDPARVTGEALTSLRARADGKPYTLMSPYPGLDQPISLQSWGHQLKVVDAADPRIDQFIQALRRNQYAYPEVGASCDALGPGQFDPSNPPPFDPSPPGPGAVPELGAGAPAAKGEQLTGPTPGGSG